MKMIILLLLGFSYADIHGLSELKAYDIIIPKKVAGPDKQATGIDFPEDQISYILSIDGKDHLVHLQKNVDVISDNCTVFIPSEDEGLTAKKLDTRAICYYHGYVDGVPNSEVMMTACSGKLSGLLKINESWYEIAPLQSSSEQHHVIYDLRNVQPEPSFCGIDGVHEVIDDEFGTEDLSQHFHTGNQYYVTTAAQRKTTKTTTRKTTTRKTTTRKTTTRKTTTTKTTTEDVTLDPADYPHVYPELYVVVDYERYTYLQSNENAVLADATKIITLANTYYKKLNLRMILSSIEVWTTRPEPVETGEIQPFRPFLAYMRSKRDSVHYDVPILFTGFETGLILGIAHLGSMCRESACMTLSAYEDSTAIFAYTLAHEMGHSLGMPHDSADCKCKDGANCIMAPLFGFFKDFSECSLSFYRDNSEVKECMKNTPRSSSVINDPSCGNGIIDKNEECDCGSHEECKKDNCCNSDTCRLIPGSECGFGQCCRDCKIVPAGTVCRNSISDCDLPEYCNGMSKYCPLNTFKADGTTCSDNNGYCFSGLCQTKDQQCRNLYGSGSVSSPDNCYEELNKNGNAFGHCGYSSYDFSYMTCWNRSALCGKLQCDNIESFRYTGAFTQSVAVAIKNSMCTAVNTTRQTDVFGGDLVLDGTRCGIGKICINFMCVPVEASSTCDEQITCNDRGVCNNKGNCHCDDGWAPPSCLTVGTGGSIDSGSPESESTSNINLLAILLPILLGIPLIIFTVVLLVKCRSVINRQYTEQHSANTL